MERIKCNGTSTHEPHELEANEVNFSPWSLRNPDSPRARCRNCASIHLAEKRGARGSAPAPAALGPVTRAEGTGYREYSYVPPKGLVEMMSAVVAAADDAPPMAVLFLGPSGSGKTTGARWLADHFKLDFTHIDAPSMTDPESWFGTRSAQGGSTFETESEFLAAVQKPGIVYVDEFTRIRDEFRAIIIPLTDDTRAVTNPLTGKTVTMDPKCFVIFGGNRGMLYTGTFTVDPAFTSRMLVWEFSYVTPDQEEAILMQASGCTDAQAYVLAQLGHESRMKAASDEDFTPVNTRVLIKAARLAAHGMKMDSAVEVAVILATDGEGGAASQRQVLKNLWGGVRAKVRPNAAVAHPQGK